MRNVRACELFVGIVSPHQTRFFKQEQRSELQLESEEKLLVSNGGRQGHIGVNNATYRGLPQS